MLECLEDKLSLNSLLNNAVQNTPRNRNLNTVIKTSYRYKQL